MSKATATKSKSDHTLCEAVTLSPEKRKRLARVFTNTYEAASTSGESITIVLAKEASAVLGGARVIDDESVQYIVNEAAKARDWAENTAIARKSEIVTLIYAIPELPALCSGFKKKTGGLLWHNTVNMARRVRSGDSVVEAIAYVADNSVKAKKPIKGKKAAMAKLTSLAKQMLKVPHLEADVKKAIQAFIIEAGIEL